MRRQQPRHHQGLPASLNGHRFDALVFPQHAKVAEWEIGDSRITELWLKRLADGEVVFNWDRGRTSFTR